MARARDIIVKPKVLRPCEVKALDGETVLAFGLRLLAGEDTKGIIKSAKDYARANGSPDASPDDAQYLRGLWVFTALLACMDLEAPTVPFFDSAEQVDRMLDDPRLIHVYQEQRDYQGEYAPSAEGITPEEYPLLVAQVTEEWKKGGDPERPLAFLRPRKLRSFTSQLVFTLSLQTDLLSQLGSPSSLPSDSSKSTESSAPSSEKQGS